MTITSIRVPEKMSISAPRNKRHKRVLAVIARPAGLSDCRRYQGIELSVEHGGGGVDLYVAELAEE